ncbi:MAG: hypothetical protein HY554_19320 [Elusimicrobia bacterium]|nr:hypothetical protein [Elusimicrobiota bacterium]
MLTRKAMLGGVACLGVAMVVGAAELKRSVGVRVCAQPVVTFTANGGDSAAVNEGDSVVLRWTAADAEEVSGTGPGFSPSGLDGSARLAPAPGEHAFTLRATTCQGARGERSQEKSVRVRVAARAREAASSSVDSAPSPAPATGGSAGSSPAPPPCWARFTGDACLTCQGFPSRCAGLRNTAYTFELQLCQNVQSLCPPDPVDPCACEISGQPWIASGGCGQQGCASGSVPHYRACAAGCRAESTCIASDSCRPPDPCACDLASRPWEVSGGCGQQGCASDSIPVYRACAAGCRAESSCQASDSCRVPEVYEDDDWYSYLPPATPGTPAPPPEDDDWYLYLPPANTETAVTPPDDRGGDPPSDSGATRRPTGPDPIARPTPVAPDTERPPECDLLCQGGRVIGGIWGWLTGDDDDFRGGGGGSSGGGGATR